MVKNKLKLIWTTLNIKRTKENVESQPWNDPLHLKTVLVKFIKCSKSVKNVL